jgi:hypothetical protein
MKKQQWYSVFRKFFDPKNPKVLQYFRVKDPYYLKWSVEKISEWKFEENRKLYRYWVIEILSFLSRIPNPIM